VRSPFRRRGRAEVTLSMSPHEAALLRNLAAQLVELLRHDEPDPRPSDDPLAALLDVDGPVDAPDDPVLARLLPPAYLEDPEAAAEFRRFTERGLRAGKVRDAAVVVETLQDAGSDGDAEAGEDVEAVLDPDSAQAWLRCLTDLRLALATRLGVEQDDEDFWERLAPDDPRAHLHDIYDWLGYLQELLVRELS
jgi:uncharacterized protein DUF2017